MDERILFVSLHSAPPTTPPFFLVWVYFYFYFYSSRDYNLAYPFSWVMAIYHRQRQYRFACLNRAICKVDNAGFSHFLIWYIYICSGPFWDGIYITPGICNIAGWEEIESTVLYMRCIHKKSILKKLKKYTRSSTCAMPRLLNPLLTESPT